MRALVVALAIVLVPVAGCLPDGEADSCSAWTREDAAEDPHQAHLHVSNERAETVCVHVQLAGEDMAKIPMQPAEGPAYADEERTVDWEDARLTVRATEWDGDAWTTQTVDLEQTPHIEIRAVEGDLEIQLHETAPS